MIEVDAKRLPFPSVELLIGSSLFLDLDGTLLELVDRPNDVQADDQLLKLLVDLGARFNGRLAIVSGRSLDQIDAILGEVTDKFAISGSHGCCPSSEHSAQLAA